MVEWLGLEHSRLNGVNLDSAEYVDFGYAEYVDFDSAEYVDFGSTEYVDFDFAENVDFDFAENVDFGSTEYVDFDSAQSTHFSSLPCDSEFPALRFLIAVDHHERGLGSNGDANLWLAERSRS